MTQSLSLLLCLQSLIFLEKKVFSPLKVSYYVLKFPLIVDYGVKLNLPPGFFLFKSENHLVSFGVTLLYFSVGIVESLPVHFFIMLCLLNNITHPLISLSLELLKIIRKLGNKSLLLLIMTLFLVAFEFLLSFQDSPLLRQLSILFFNPFDLILPFILEHLV